MSNKDGKAFLKIDVQGAEYRFLGTLVDQSDKIAGCVIEFHECDLHLRKIEKFIESFDLKIIYIHANNFQPVCHKSKLPTVLEVTFSKNAENELTPKLPNASDMPNRRDEPEIELAFTSNYSNDLRNS